MDFTSWIGSLPSAVISLALGLLICFGGYRLRKAGIMLVGALLGFSLGSRIAGYFVAQSAALLAGLVVAAAVALFCSWLYDAGIFMFCGACGALFVSTFLEQSALPQAVRFLLLLAVFVAVGLLALRFVRPVVILSSSFSGASSILSSLALLGLAIPAGWTYLIILLALSVVGIGVQFATTRG